MEALTFGSPERPLIHLSQVWALNATGSTTVLMTKTGKASAAGQSRQVGTVFYLLKTTEGGSSSEKRRIDFIQSKLLRLFKITQIHHKENHQQSHYCQRGLYKTAWWEWGNINWSFHVSVFYCIFRGLNSPNRFRLITLHSETWICCCELDGTDDECVCVFSFIPSAFHDGNLITNGHRGFQHDYKGVLT